MNVGQFEATSSRTQHQKCKFCAKRSSFSATAHAKEMDFLQHTLTASLAFLKTHASAIGKRTAGWGAESMTAPQMCKMSELPVLMDSSRIPPKDTQPVLENAWNTSRPLLPRAFNSACHISNDNASFRDKIWSNVSQAA